MNRFTLLIIIILLIFSCDSNIRTVFNDELDKIENKYVLDKSITIFNISLDKNNNGWILRGETTLQDAKKSVMSLADSLLGNSGFQDSIIVLPHHELGADTLAVVNVSVANLRRNPSVAAELIDQVLLGDKLRVLKTKNQFWKLVQTEYGYIGYILSERINAKSLESKWFSNPMVKATVLNGNIYSRPDDGSDIVSNFVINSKINLLITGAYWSHIELPDGRSGFIKNSDYLIMGNEPVEISVENLIATAKSMMGIPYLWGGNSSKMNDCSGYTQTVFLANGISLPRDARQQALAGKTVEYDSTFQDVKPGDLLFFGLLDKITHVGISLGGFNFIDQNGYVKIKSLNDQAVKYSEWSKNNLQFIKRVF